MSLLPRTVIHLFYYDHVAAGNLVLDNTQNEIAAGEHTDSEIDAFNRQYKLLFMGELQTLSVVKTAQSRAVILNCVDFSNYWDTTFQYNFNGSLFAGQRQAIFTGANSNFFTSPLGHGQDTVSRLLNQNSANFPELRGLLAGVVRMLEAIGGSYYGNTVFKGCTDFASIAELRIKLLQQIAAAEKDTSSAKLFARKMFHRWMSRRIGSLGRLVSFRGLTKILFQFIYHECYPCPVPKFIPGTAPTTEKVKLKKNIGDTPHSNFAKQCAATKAMAEKAFASDFLLPSGQTTAATTLFSSDLIKDSVDYLKAYEATESALKILYHHSIYGGPALLSTQHSGLSEVSRRISVAWTTMQRIRTLSRSGSSFTPREVQKNIVEIRKLWAVIIRELGKVADVQITTTSTKTTQSQPRVNNQIFRPEIYFAPPPRCNVLFPEDYHTFNFQQNFFRECSRMELQTHNEITGPDALFNGRYYAPDVADVRSGIRLSSRVFARKILDHELFTGIVPMFQSMPEANIYAMHCGRNKTAGAKVPYAQRAVNFLYFKHRFASRSLTASGIFNPKFVPGFPGLLIDRTLDRQSLSTLSLSLSNQLKSLNMPDYLSQEIVLQRLVGPQYLGVCAQLTHSVSQQGGLTSYAFTQARIHRETTEFLGVDKKQIKVFKGKGSKKSVIAAPSKARPKVGDAGPLGRIIGIRDVTKGHTGKLMKILNTQFRGYVGKPIRWALHQRSLEEEQKEQERLDQQTKLLLAQKGVAGAAAAQAKAAGAVVGKTLWVFLSGKTGAKKSSGVTNDLSDFLNDTLKAYELTQEIGIYASEETEVPIEEALAAPWVWDGWKNPKINDTYQQLFGIASINDAVGSIPVDPITEVLGGSTQTEGEVVTNPGKSVESAVDDLVRLYSTMQHEDMDLGEFLRIYGWRASATMVDILGGSDLQIKPTTIQKTQTVRQRVTIKQAEEGAKPVYGSRLVKRTISYPGYKITGKDGFHSRAFGDVEDLFGLVNPTVRRVLNLTRDRTKVASKLDVRKRRRAVVHEYIAELMEAQGLLG